MTIRNTFIAAVTVLSLGGLTAGTARAQNPAAPGAGVLAGKQHTQRVGRRLPALTAFRAVTPTAEQEARFKPLAEKLRTDLMALRGEQPEQRRVKAKELNAKFTADVRALLTPDQQTRFDEEMAKAKRDAGARGLMTRLGTALSLTDEQKAKIEPIVKEGQEQLAKLRDDQSMDRQARAQKARQIVDDMKAKIRPLLTPDQQSKLDAMKSRIGAGRGRGAAPRAGGAAGGAAL